MTVHDFAEKLVLGAMLSGPDYCRGLPNANARKHGIASDLLPCIGARHAFAASGFAFHGLLPGSESMAPKFNLLQQVHVR